jgi:hypothetical protein
VLCMTSINIRGALPSDRPALNRLAELDSAPAIFGPALVAEVGGRIVAAVGLRSGAKIADPFVPTADLLALLELHAHSREALAA